MAEGSDGGQDKSHEATPHKLEQARRRGQVVQSRDLVTLGVFLGLLGALAGFAPGMTKAAGTALLPLLDRPDQILSSVRATGIAGLVAKLVLDMSAALVPLFLLPALGAALVLVAQRTVVVASERIQPKLNRLSPLANASQKFGVKGLVEFGKSFVKIALVGIAVGMALQGRIPDLLALLRTDAAALGPALLGATADLLFPVVIVSALIGGVDYLWQRFDFMKSQRMSLQELRDEHKSSEGDPHLKQMRRQRAVAIATNRMMQDVPKADVVIVNPTHVAVALRWDRARKAAAPECVAKGVDAVALAIRRIAEEHGVALVEDRPLARSLHGMVEIGQEIRVEHYRAVAAALQFAARHRERRRQGAGTRPARPSTGR
ncbi:EscU/YscU/HrcU family type III secretion system export apparatus switch protein [Marinivivus vitaminiproducens]|uniref:EscU/YscU/HrcU family type III secretion system export apparatus switch protein n=1 Tax=Marinivivus vitaminiproducens TaxID=3035935 RepID=UPI0027980B49|nr:flagellar type III secretion system protein FlhB [Geminicoccaceae bacterium SCSIO 64248]